MRQLLCGVFLIVAGYVVAANPAKLPNNCETNDISKEAIDIRFASEANFETQYECCPGFERTIGNCQPVCSKDCGLNSYCKSPENCECFEGFELDENNTCVNKKDPNLCIRKVEVEVNPVDNSGWENLEQAFKELNLTLPTPYPSTYNTEIRHVCCDGYGRQSDEDMCQPLCSEECEKYSYCSKPNVCECKPGFEKLNGYCHQLCEPACRENTYCRNGKFCECIEGYYLLAGDCVKFTEDASSPEEPNLCTKEVGHSQCQPVCPDNCGAHSHCGESGICECELNYRVAPNGVCIKDTTEFQANDPNLCMIKKKNDYIDISKLLSIPGNFNNVIKNKFEVQLFCCPGYEQETKGSLCQPQCMKGCGINCRCVEPETCQCDAEVGPNHEMCKCTAGYIQNQYGICEPVCTEACPAHSSCIKPEQCQCNEGYDNRNRTGNFSPCHPICLDNIPEYGRCVRPDEWECISGYIKLPSPNGQDYCAPHCQEMCVTFSTCVAPNVCVCLPGFRTTTIEIEQDEPQDLCVRIKNPAEQHQSIIESETTDSIIPDSTPFDISKHPAFSYRFGGQ